MNDVLMVLLACGASVAISNLNASEGTVHIRANQLGYHLDDAKVAIAFSKSPLEGEFHLIDRSGAQVFAGKVRPVRAPSWGQFQHYVELDFTDFKKPGRYFLQIGDGEKSREFGVGNDAYQNYQNDLLVFMRQQRCGYNPYLDMVCHKRDGRTAYGPLPAGSFVDASGGWHDAGDQLKYLITGSNATARMLLAYELDPTKFGDRADDLGRPLPNGIADVLDEAKWGLDWLHRLHPHPKHLYHQVADDRDHDGWKYPDQDTSDYGWGPNSYRVVYFADGKPQGLAEHKSQATGVANLAGRVAAAMAIGSRIWRDELNDPVFADKCLRAAREVYELGKENEGYQQGNSYGAPYRYNENTWADDMEWGAAELYKVTQDEKYLADAERYAEMFGAGSWMHHDTVDHYEMYPFLNVGHFALYPHASPEMQKKLAGYYREGIEATINRSKRNPFGIGVPFIWCSNNLCAALVTQILLYERMTGDDEYHDYMLAQRDWLLGRNPWGTTMFTGIPRNGEYPEDIHTSIWHLTKKMVPGGLVDGPVYTSVFESLLGLHLHEEDEFAAFQNDHVVYHDDIGDYSTNEPTMDGTADAITMMAHFGAVDLTSPALNPKREPTATAESEARLTFVEGGIIRGPRDHKRLALIFTGGDHGEGTEGILDTLAEKHVKASLFVTGGYLENPDHVKLLQRAVAEGHYLGPHSNGHLLYADWNDRGKSLVGKAEFQWDLERNLRDIRQYTGPLSERVYFVPPYEWYNAEQSQWARELGCVLINFTPGSGSHRDWAPEGDKAFKPSDEIVQTILAHEQSDGLNGHLLLMHLGSQRQDKMHEHLGGLIDELVNRGYDLVRVDKLLEPGSMVAE